MRQGGTRLAYALQMVAARCAVLAKCAARAMGKHCQSGTAEECRGANLLRKIPTGISDAVRAKLHSVGLSATMGKRGAFD